jgi:hypothetical protein
MITLQDIKRLPRKQRDALGQVCSDRDGGLHPQTLEALKRKGFIRSFKQTLGGHRFAVEITRYVAPANVIVEWRKFYERCSCGVIAERGKVCGNPETSRCTSRVRYGTYNRKSKRYE